MSCSSPVRGLSLPFYKVGVLLTWDVCWGFNYVLIEGLLALACKGTPVEVFVKQSLVCLLGRDAK